VELGFADEIMFAEKKTESKPEPEEQENEDSDGDDDTPEEEEKKDGAVHLLAQTNVETLEGVLYSTRAMGQTILNSIGAYAEDKAPHTEGEVTPAEGEPEGEAAPVAENTAAQEVIMNADPDAVDHSHPTPAEGETSGGEAEQAETRETRNVLPDGFIAINMDGRTKDGSVPYIILKNQLDRMR
jgi:hypothetical protein